MSVIKQTLHKLFKRKSKLDIQLDDFIKTHTIYQIYELKQKYQNLLTHTMTKQTFFSDGSENYYCGVLNFLDDAENRLCSLEV